MQAFICTHLLANAAEYCSMGVARAIVPGRAYMVTRRCADRRFFLRPDKETNNAFTYCLALAAQKAGVEVFFVMAESNHWHGGIIDRQGSLPVFLEHFHKLLAKHQNAKLGRWENIWDPRQTSVVELVDSEDALDKLVYALGNPVKDHLVQRARSWPGVSSYLATLTDSPLRATRPRAFFKRANTNLPTSVSLPIARAPGYERLSQQGYAELVQKAVHQLEEAAAAERAQTGQRVLGRRAILRQHWNDRPRNQEPHRQLSPRVACSDKWRRIEVLARNKAWLAAYRAARDAVRAGIERLFPAGTWLAVRLHGAGVARAPALPG